MSAEALSNTLASAQSRASSPARNSSQELYATLLMRIMVLVLSRSLVPDPPAGLGGIVEDRPAGDASGELEHVAEPLTDAPGGLAPEDLGGPTSGRGKVTVRCLPLVTCTATGAPSFQRHRRVGGGVRRRPRDALDVVQGQEPGQREARGGSSAPSRATSSTGPTGGA